MSTLFMCVWVSGCSLTTSLAPVVSPTQLPRITLTLRVRETRTPTASPTSPTTTTSQPRTPAAHQFYTVRPGDTLLGIALDLGLDVEQIKAANPNLDPLALQVGQQVVIPQPGMMVAAAVTPPPPQLDSPICFDMISGSVLCLGQVSNQHDQPITSVQVHLRLRDGNGKLLAEANTSVEQMIILPGQSAPYSAIFDAEGQVQADAVLLRAVPASGQEVLVLDVEDQITEFNGSRYHIISTIVNKTGVTTQPPRMVLTLFDSQGHVVGFRVITGTQGLEPGARQQVEIEAVAQAGTDDLTHHLHVEAYPL